MHGHDFATICRCCESNSLSVHVNHFSSFLFLSSYSIRLIIFVFFVEKKRTNFLLHSVLCIVCFRLLFRFLFAFKVRENNYVDEYQRAISRMTHKATEHIFNVYSFFSKMKKRNIILHVEISWSF